MAGASGATIRGQKTRAIAAGSATVPELSANPPSPSKQALPLVLSGVCLLCLAACVDPEPGSGVAEPPPELRISRLAIDTGQAIELEPGAGVGVAVTYEGDGTWQVSTACDTLATGALCEFDIIARTGGEDELVLLDDSQLEQRDDGFFLDPFALELLLQTGDDVDGVTLSASPGAVLRLTVWLYDPIVDSQFDWTRDPRLLSWVGNGAVHWGAPTNPVELEPSAP